ncbi:MAG: sortase [bacterium]|nr:sortase [bacterium]
MNRTLTEEDLVKIFSYKNNAEKRHNLLFQFFYYGLFFMFFIIVVYVVINFGAVSETLTFWYKSNFTTQTADQTTVQVAAPGVPTLESDKYTVPNVSSNHIAIPVVDVNAPITFGVNNTAKEVAASLENGVIQINGTSLPGQTGNVYITGHSSNYIWSKGDYNSVFAILDKLVIGDLIYINYNNIVYEYQIFDRKIVLPNDTSMLKSTIDSRLTLVTCWPIGTTLKRLVLLANQIHPDPKNNTVPNTPANFQSLPSGR